MLQVGTGAHKKHAQIAYRRRDPQAPPSTLRLLVIVPGMDDDAPAQHKKVEHNPVENWHESKLALREEQRAVDDGHDGEEGHVGREVPPEDKRSELGFGCQLHREVTPLGATATISQDKRRRPSWGHQ